MYMLSVGGCSNILLFSYFYCSPWYVNKHIRSLLSTNMLITTLVVFFLKTNLTEDSSSNQLIKKDQYVG